MRKQNEMTDSYPNIEMAILNTYGLNIPIKDRWTAH